MGLGLGKGAGMWRWTNMSRLGGEAAPSRGSGLRRWPVPLPAPLTTPWQVRGSQD